jgi:hypothetical protein
LNDFNQLPCVHALETALACHGNGVLYSGIKALLFMFYCKFGGQYANEALYCIAYRISELRNAGQIRMSYLQTEPVFMDSACMLDRSTILGEFFAWTIHPRYAYKPVFEGATRCAYWESLHALLDKLESDAEFAIKSATQTITRSLTDPTATKEVSNG